MPPILPPDGHAPFTCQWRREGPGAASVQVSGELDLATGLQLEQALDEALASARLVLLDVGEVSCIDSTGLHVIVTATSRARADGGRLLLTGASKQVEALVELTAMRAHVDVLRPDVEIAGAQPSRASDEDSMRPLDNPVNAGVVMARVMAVSDEQLWVHAANGAIHRPWAPMSDGLPLPIGAAIDVYLDAGGAVNGWLDPRSGLAINQRRLERGENPMTASDLACQGPCEVVWRAPAAARLAEHAERCLTCAGHLVLR